MKKRILTLLLCVALCVPNSLVSMAAQQPDVIIVDAEETEEACEECQAEEGHLETCSKYVAPDEVTGCEECNQSEGHLETCSQYAAPEIDAPLCEKCNAVEGEDGNIVHEETCELYIPVEALLKDMLMATTSTSEMYEVVLEYMNNEPKTLLALTAEEIAELREYIAELDPESDDIDTADLLDTLAVLPNGGEELVGDPVMLASNVYNETQGRWYDTLSAATEAAKDNDVIEVHNSFTEITSVKIQKQNLTIRAAEDKEPTISWTKTDEVDVPGATSYHCVVIYTSVNTSTTFGGGSGTLTFDATQASNDKHKGERARVMMHCGSGTLYLKDGIVLTGGNPGGGSYNDKKGTNPKPDFSGEITGETGFGAGLFMYAGKLEMSGGVIKDNYTLWGTSTDHNYVGGGGGVYLYGTTDGKNSTTMVMTGGTITHNAAGSGGGAGILVGYGSTLNMSGGTISENVCNFASGGGIGVRKGSKVTVSGGLIKDNKVEGHGGGLFARGDSIPLEITGGTFENNTAGGYGGGILFWTVGDNAENNTVIIDGNAIIKYNHASNGGGVSVGREVLDGKPIGNKAKLVIKGNPSIFENTADNNGGGIHMQSDEFSEAVNTVEIFGGTIDKNEAKNGAGIYVPGGIVTMTGGNFTENIASDRGGGIFTGGGTMTISDAAFSKNKAENFGGGVYVVGGSITMNSGSFSENGAKSGGAVYITKEGTGKVSNFTMSGGSLLKNAVSEDGGAVYVNGGNITMSGGEISENSATKNGGALYIKGGDFTMTSGKLLENKAGNDMQRSNGGGAYVYGGNITIGVESCEGGEEDTKHNVTQTDKIHPVIKLNSATDSGGGLALIGNGNINMYCGHIVENDATNRGRGRNVYMESGVFKYFKGAKLGDPENPEVVIVGGKLENMGSTEGDIDLLYHHCNDQAEFPGDHNDDLADKNATETKSIYFNLPDGEKYWVAPDGYRFFGWTFYGPNDKNAPDHVRNKKHYKPLGESIKATDTYDGITDNTIEMYALWAPKTSNITYAGSVVDGTYIQETLNVTGENGVYTPEKVSVGDNSNLLKYGFSVSDYTITLNSPTKAGYTFMGWYYYQDEDKNANWGIEPIYKEGTSESGKGYNTLDYNSSSMGFLPVDNDGKCYLKVVETNFGDLTMIAKFEPAYADLKISKTGANEELDENQSFLFNIYCDPDDPLLEDVNMTVTIQGNGTIEIKDLPVGTYTITELTDWSWRYKKQNPRNITLSDPETTKEVEFVNEREDDKWFSEDCYCENWWNKSNNNKVEKR